ncbi:MAG: undecaprenyl-diphosphate phosphatase [Actinomycetota bacterium]|nr:undecaprenyl-diphosphate phosphatase [Actinomycetota bacterium]
MNVVEAMILGLVQGLTEFIPISSKTHLIMIPALLGWKGSCTGHSYCHPPLPFLTLLHAGTLVAALIYFRREIMETLDGLDRPSPGRKLILLLIVGTIPAAVLGFIFEDRLQKLFDQPALASLALVLTAVILTATETLFRRRSHEDKIEETVFSDVEKITSEVDATRAGAIGLAQSLALLPGISRAGTTIGAGLLAGLPRAQAARFSFMLSLPIIAGTVLAEVPKLSHFDIGLVPTLVGFFAALVAGYAAIAGMIGYLQKRGLYPFAAYCLVVGPIAYYVLTR